MIKWSIKNNISREINLGIKVSENQVRKALSLIQTLDPPGIGARNLKEFTDLRANKDLWS